MKVIDSSIFQLPGNPHMLHLGTIEDGFRQYVVMTCISGQHRGKTYIEEVVLTSTDWTKDVFANLKFIENDNEAHEVALYAETKGLTNVKERLNELIDTGRLGLINGNSPIHLPK
jgi:hypothetical protein